MTTGPNPAIVNARSIGRRTPRVARSVPSSSAARRTIALFNPVVYLVSGFRWSFYDTADVAVGVSLAAVGGFLIVLLVVVGWIFKTGYRLKK